MKSIKQLAEEWGDENYKEGWDEYTGAVQFASHLDSLYTLTPKKIELLNDFERELRRLAKETGPEGEKKEKAHWLDCMCDRCEDQRINGCHTPRPCEHEPLLEALSPKQRVPCKKCGEYPFPTPPEPMVELPRKLRNFVTDSSKTSNHRELIRELHNKVNEVLDYLALKKNQP